MYQRGQASLMSTDRPGNATKPADVATLVLVRDRKHRRIKGLTPLICPRQSLEPSHPSPTQRRPGSRSATLPWDAGLVRPEGAFT